MNGTNSNRLPMPRVTMESVTKAVRQMEAVHQREIRRVQETLSPILDKPLPDDAAEVILLGKPGQCKYLPEGVTVFHHEGRMVFLLPSKEQK